MRSKHEKYLYVAAAGHYQAVDDAERMRAERIEGLVSQNTRMDFRVRGARPL